MNDRNCGTCAAWHEDTCNLSPPTPVLFGMQQTPISALTGKPVAPPQPVFAFVRPSTKAEDFCMMHHVRS